MAAPYDFRSVRRLYVTSTWKGIISVVKLGWVRPRFGGTVPWLAILTVAETTVREFPLGWLSFRINSGRGKTHRGRRAERRTRDIQAGVIIFSLTSGSLYPYQLPTGGYIKWIWVTPFFNTISPRVYGTKVPSRNSSSTSATLQQ